MARFSREKSGAFACGWILTREGVWKLLKDTRSFPARMHHALDKKIYTGIAVALALFPVLAAAMLWQTAQAGEARMLGLAAVLASLAYAVLLGIALFAMRRGARDRGHVARGLQDMEALNTGMIESSTDCIALLDTRGRLKVVNSPMWRWMEEIGIQPVEDMPWVGMWNGEPRRAAESILASAISGKVGRFQGMCHVRSGEGRWYDVVVSPVLDAHNRPERLLVVSRDVTASHSSEEKFRVLFDQSANAHFIFDGDLSLIHI